MVDANFQLWPSSQCFSSSNNTDVTRGVVLLDMGMSTHPTASGTMEKTTVTTATTTMEDSTGNKVDEYKMTAGQ